MGVLVITDPRQMPATGLKHEVGRAVKAEIRQMLVDIEGDKVGHAEAVARGPFYFREAFTKHMAPAWGMHKGQCGHLADVCYQFMQARWREKYPGESTAWFLDKVHVPSPQSEAEFEREVEDAWRLDIASTDEGMQHYYRGDARVRTGRDAFSTFWHRTADEIKARLKRLTGRR